MCKRMMLAGLLVVVMGFGGVWAADFDKGMEAYDKGDYATALKEWRPLAEQGHAKAQNGLGVVYADEQGVAQDYKQAFHWFQKAAEQGDATAQVNLGLMYYNGDGVTQDYKQAVYWYQKAAEQKYARAQNNLGVMYEKGQGVAQDYVSAHVWFNLASANGHDKADENRDLVAKEMTTEQIDEAQGRAKRCIETGYKEC